MTIQWIQPADDNATNLPHHGQTVLVWTGEAPYYVAGAIFRMGKTAEELEDAPPSVVPWDQCGSNEKPYGWETELNHLDGQEVAYWAEINPPEIPESLNQIRMFLEA